MVKRKLSRSEAQEEAAAFHEAGHAFLAWDLNILFSRKGLAILPQGEGHCSLRRQRALEEVHQAMDVSGKGRLRMERAVQVCLAGIEAQQRYRPSSIEDWHGTEDYHQAVSLIGRFSPHPRELAPYIELLRIRVQIRLEAQYGWKCVETLAAALFEKKALSGGEITNLIETAMSGKCVQLLAVPANGSSPLALSLSA
jgi:hypothetical protein